MTLEGQGALVGQRLGQYQLDALLGAGGMAEVYRAHAVGRAGPPVAVKILPASLAADPGYVRRFREEADRVQALEHPNIVRVLTSGEQRGLLYLVMPLLKESLRDRLYRDKVLSPTAAAGIARQIGAALAFAHDAGLIHRDVKPENILLDWRGNAHLTDFGIARPLAPRRGGTLYTVSGSGLPVGTPEYMPPEQLRAEHIDQRADIYALGAVLYEMLTGTVPFPADTPYEVAALVFTAPLPSPRQHNLAITPQLEQVVMKALQRDPKDRFQDARSFVQALQTATQPPGLLERAGLRRDRITQHLSNYFTPHAAPVLPGRTGIGAPVPAGMTGAQTVPRTPSITEMPTARPGSWPTGVPTLVPAARRAARSRWVLIGGIVALLAVTVCGGGSLAAASKLGLVFARAEPTVTPTVTVAPTETPLPTETPVPTETPRPIPMLVVGSFTNWQGYGSRTCHWSAQQQVSNPGDGRAMGWRWQAVTPTSGSASFGSSFRWGFTSSPSSIGMPYASSQTAGASSTLYVSFTVSGYCVSGNKYTVEMYDGLNRSYTFTMQPNS